MPDHAMVPSGAEAPGWPRMLVVDSDPVMRQILVCLFEKRGFHVAAGASVAEAKAFFHRCKRWTLIVSDYHLPDGTGWDLCCWVRAQTGASTPFLLMSGSAYCATLCEGTDYLAKPFRLEALESRLQAMLLRQPQL